MSKELYFKCTLKSNIVLNASLATEGNMKSLDYIPGSNFMGIVASMIYKENQDLAMDYIHSGKVKYGDAYISNGVSMSYTIPFSVYTNKLNPELVGENKKYLHHLITKDNFPKDSNGRSVQLQQKRTGYFNLGGELWKEVDKVFSLKSAYDSEKRKSKDSQMFGFDSIVKGQIFVFSVIIDDDLDEKIILKALEGDRKVGKSKSAEFGWVNIEQIKDIDKINTYNTNGDYAIVYAHSNLCFYDENGLPTYQPTAKDLGFSTGEIDWARSQVRIYKYSPWNAYRSTVSTQRNCILKGSVFYIEKPQFTGNIKQVGEYINEGLGRIIINPAFLFDVEGIEWKFNLTEAKRTDAEVKKQKETDLTKYLKTQKDKKDLELTIANKVFDLVEKEKRERVFLDITSSQWGCIRQMSSETTNFDMLIDNLTGNNGVLQKGVAYDRYWGKKNNKALKQLNNILEDNKNLGTIFIAKLASEYAKINYTKK